MTGHAPMHRPLVAFPEVDYTATVQRPRFDQLPSAVRTAIAQAAGSSVVAADDPPGSGFTGGFASVLHLADGRRVFAKAGSSVNPHLVSAYAQEAMVLQQLPPTVPAPTLVGSAHLAAGEADEYEWQVVVAQAVAGALPQPWTERALALVHEACLQCAEVLTPGPSSLDLPTVAAHFGENPTIVRTFGDLRAGELPLTWGQPTWVPGRYDELESLVSGAVEHLRGSTACHGDLRADNTIIEPPTSTSPGRAVLVDWNWLMRGPAWTDFVGVLPLARADGVDVDRWLRTSSLTRDVDAESVDAFLATIAAYMLGSADAPVWPGGPPSVRVHQRRYAGTFLDWLGERRGWA